MNIRDKEGEAQGIEARPELDTPDGVGRTDMTTLTHAMGESEPEIGRPSIPSERLLFGQGDNNPPELLQHGRGDT